MNDKVKNVVLGISALTALALGGSAIAGAAPGNNANNSSSTTAAPSRTARPAAATVGRDTAER